MCGRCGRGICVCMCVSMWVVWVSGCISGSGVLVPSVHAWHLSVRVVPCLFEPASGLSSSAQEFTQAVVPVCGSEPFPLLTLRRLTPSLLTLRCPEMWQRLNGVLGETHQPPLLQKQQPLCPHSAERPSCLHLEVMGPGFLEPEGDSVPEGSTVPPTHACPQRKPHAPLPMRQACLARCVGAVPGCLTQPPQSSPPHLCQVPIPCSHSRHAPERKLWRELSSHPGSSLLCTSKWHRNSQCCEELPDDVSEL